jgi:HAD superfamily hydrolase (TIGR01549 family)
VNTAAAPIVVLDVDGTLVDTNYHHAIAWYRAFRRFGETIPLARLHRYMGMGGDQLVAEVAGEEFDERHGDDVREAEKEEYGRLIDEVAALEHATELIRALQERGAQAVLASSAKEWEIGHYVELLGVEDVPTTDSSDVETTKPQPDLVQAALEKAGGDGPALMIGDTTWDAKAAAGAGVPMVGILTGGFSAEELRRAGAVDVFDHLEDLLGDLDRALAHAGRDGDAAPR